MRDEVDVESIKNSNNPYKRRKPLSASNGVGEKLSKIIPCAKWFQTVLTN
jgi:hypothetical protein